MLLLVEQGVLGLQATVGELVPDFAAQFPVYANYTVDDLLRMKTIVPDFIDVNKHRSKILPAMVAGKPVEWQVYIHPLPRGVHLKC